MPAVGDGDLPTRRPAIPAEYQAAEDLERFLGNPADPATETSFRHLVECDERSEPPHRMVAQLTEWGLPQHLIPRAHGGRLRSAEELFAVLRSVARRDLTVAVGYGATLLAAIPVWAWGTDQQRRRVADLIGGGAFGSLGLSEAEHGSDVLASELTAEPCPDGFVLTGTKWPIGNATRGAFATVFARTGRPGSPRGFSMFLVDKANTAPHTWSCEPRVPTLGLRGGDVSGITFQQARLPAGALIASQGSGLEVALKTLQNTRTLLPALSLGAADTALRVTLEHVGRRQLYGRSVHAIPVIREQLLSAHLDLLIAECVALSAVRAITVAPRRLSLWSAITKYLVPVIVNELLASLAEVLGARHYLRQGLADGIFQKILRDHGIVGVFDGTTHVNLHVVASQLPSVLRCSPAEGTVEPLLRRLFSLADPAPGWQLRAPDLRLTNDGLDEITQAWPLAVAAVEKICADDGSPHGDALRATVQQLDAHWRDHLATVACALRDRPTLHSTARGFALARTHCLLHAAAACTHTWLTNRERLGEFHRDGEWLLLCLHRLLTRLRPDQHPTLPENHVPEVEHHLLECARQNRQFSLIPIALGLG
jgi:alkylation response protein AidB-like acyl-CoA dehydrogenase